MKGWGIEAKRTPRLPITSEFPLYFTGASHIPEMINLAMIQHKYLHCSCDADPQALAKYVIALIKKEKSAEELKPLCLSQLDVFLQESKGIQLHSLPI